MEDPSLRRAVDRLLAHLPGGVRHAVKRRYHARGARRLSTRTRAPWWLAPRAAQVESIDRDDALTPLLGPAGRRPADLCFVPPGPLDPVIETLIRCERDGTAVAVLVRHRAQLDSEVAHCAAVLVVLDDQLREPALSVVPAERIVTWNGRPAATRGARLAPVLTALGFRVTGVAGQ